MIYELNKRGYSYFSSSRKKTLLGYFLNVILQNISTDDMKNKLKKRLKIMMMIILKV